jgi:hypothetical protein
MLRILEKIHLGSGENHSGSTTLVEKFWSVTVQDAAACGLNCRSSDYQEKAVIPLDARDHQFTDNLG